MLEQETDYRLGMIVSSLHLHKPIFRFKAPPSSPVLYHTNGHTERSDPLHGQLRGSLQPFCSSGTKSRLPICKRQIQHHVSRRIEAAGKRSILPAIYKCERIYIGTCSSISIVSIRRIELGSIDEHDLRPFAAMTRQTNGSDVPSDGPLCGHGDAIVTARCHNNQGILTCLSLLEVSSLRMCRH